ncbi:hypothetical protein LEP1GSC066_0442 [Leptospira sp. serovar Kenya str. Sh9]|nr:hypothetical protein LEP1GSC066_0442 [Leptospira sp. serovar Kenya str. Sh9]
MILLRFSSIFYISNGGLIFLFTINSHGGLYPWDLFTLLKDFEFKSLI